uniref:tetratricopeptide repeat protein n=1 Tax=Flavobacterium sp. TaxID=239 RepID=UPI0040494306
MKNSISLLALFAGVAIFAQTPKKEKNKEVLAQNATTEANFRKQYAKSESSKDAYNLATSIHKQKQATEAKITYAAAAEKATTKAEKHKIYHNLGNVFMEEKKYSEAVEAYKNALRNNPNDEETRYNFALAKEMLEKNPPENNDGGDDDKNKDQNQDKQDQKDQQNQDKKEDQKDQQDKNDKDGKQDEQDKPKDEQDQKNNDSKPNEGGEQKPQGIAKESLERLLDAVDNEEQKVQDKVNAQKVKGKPVKTDKDW